MIANLFEVKESPGKGKGLFAKQLIPKGTIVSFRCGRCRTIMPRKEFYKKPETERKRLLFHVYIMGDNVWKDCDAGIYLNHSCDANILDSGRDFDIAVRDIRKGEEATYDYRVFNEENGGEFECRCGSEECCGNVTFARPVPKELEEKWGRKVRSAMGCLRKVPQPLKDEMISHSEEHRKLFGQQVFILAKEIMDNGMQNNKSKA